MVFKIPEGKVDESKQYTAFSPTLVSGTRLELKVAFRFEGKIYIGKDDEVIHSQILVRLNKEGVNLSHMAERAGKVLDHGYVDVLGRFFINEEADKMIEEGSKENGRDRKG